MVIIELKFIIYIWCIRKKISPHPGGGGGGGVAEPKSFCVQGRREKRLGTTDLKDKAWFNGDCGKGFF